ncbi:MAG: gamma-glutamyltransferase [Pirellulales bacterium]
MPRIVVTSFLLLAITTLRPGLQAEEITWKASGKGGAVAAGNADAVAAGLQILKQGGNAADAATATLLALAVTDYGLFAIGGEVPLLIYDAKKKEVKVLCGLGAAPMDQEAIDWFYANGIPSNGSMKSAPVPGAVDLCVTALKLYGTISFEQAAAPTLALLDQAKKEWHQPLAATLRKLIEAEKDTTGSREEKLTAARDRFYKGDVADELEAWYIQTGAFLRKRDLAAHRTRVEDPVSVNYRGYTVFKCGPWTQGPYLCQTLRLLEGFDLKGMEYLSADYIHIVTEALKLGFADRDQYYGDPRFVKVPIRELLSDQYTKIRRPLIDREAASLERRPGDPVKMRSLLSADKHEDSPAKIPVQDTTTCVVADRWGNVVAATPSCNLVGNEPGPSGVSQGNRIRSLNTMLGHPNRVQPGKRPRITLTPTLITKDGKPVVAISVAGGDLQDQTTLNVLLNHIEFGMPPEKAVTAPRFNSSHHQNSFDPNPDRTAAFVGAAKLRVHEGVAEEVQMELERRGHVLSTTGGAIGAPVMILFDHDSGVISAAGDLKAGRHAAALE